MRERYVINNQRRKQRRYFYVHRFASQDEVMSFRSPVGFLFMEAYNDILGKN